MNCRRLFNLLQFYWLLLLFYSEKVSTLSTKMFGRWLSAFLWWFAYLTSTLYTWLSCTCHSINYSNWKNLYFSSSVFTVPSNLDGKEQQKCFEIFVLHFQGLSVLLRCYSTWSMDNVFLNFEPFLKILLLCHLLEAFAFLLQ